MFSAFSTQDAFYEIMELCSRGTLFELLQSRRCHVLLESELRGVLKSLVDALTYLRNELVLHRDIKAANILITEDYRVVSGEIGAECLIVRSKLYKLHRNCLTLALRSAFHRWFLRHQPFAVPPITYLRMCFVETNPYNSACLSREIINSKPYSFPSDVWSVGCLVLTCLTGLPPFEVNYSQI